MTPAEQRWNFERFCHYGVEGAAKDLFEDGYVDVAVMLPTDLRDFSSTASTPPTNAPRSSAPIPERSCSTDASTRATASAAWSVWRPITRNTVQGREALHGRVERRLQGLHADATTSSRHTWRNACSSASRTSTSTRARPSTRLNRDAFDVRDVDYVATDFPALNFIVDHCGMPRIDDFCWIAGQEPNVYGGLALVPSFIHARPKYFAQMLADLLFFLGPDRLIFGSDYGITSPKWIVEKFMAFEFPDDIAQEAGRRLTLEVKRKILGLNAARLYGLPVPAECRIAGSAAADGEISLARGEVDVAA